MKDFHVLRFIDLRRNIYNNEVGQFAGVIDGILHGRFSSHGVAYDGHSGKVMINNKMIEILGEDRIIKNITVKRLAVIALVYDVYSKIFTQLFGKAYPVVQHAEQSVKNDDRWP